MNSETSTYHNLSDFNRAELLAIEMLVYRIAHCVVTNVMQVCRLWYEEGREPLRRLTAQPR